MRTIKTFDLDFIGLGAAKSATTWIFDCLCEHPEICGSKPKEVVFFADNNYPRGVEWYARHFDHCSPDTITGEFSASYLHRAETVAPRIHRHFPDVKLIACLRNPIERFISAQYFKRETLGHTDRDFETELRKDKPEGNVNTDLPRGLYGRQLETYLSYFPREQMYIGIYEDIGKDPLAFIQDIYRFLGVDDTFVPPSLTTRSNVTRENTLRSRTLKSMYYRLQKIVGKSKRRDIFFWLGRVTGLRWLIRTLFVDLNTRAPDETAVSDKKVSSEVRSRLREYYQDDIHRVERLLERDLSFWT